MTLAERERGHGGGWTKKFGKSEGNEIMNPLVEEDLNFNIQQAA